MIVLMKAPECMAATHLIYFSVPLQVWQQPGCDLQFTTRSANGYIDRSLPARLPVTECVKHRRPSHDEEKDWLPSGLLLIEFDKRHSTPLLDHFCFVLMQK